jgi:hypothetical protein
MEGQDGFVSLVYAEALTDETDEEETQPAMLETALA